MAVDAACPRCRVLVVVGLDDDSTALTASVDPYPLDPVGETVALLTGRATYDAWPLPDGRVELTRRDRFSIAGPRRVPVVADHECGKQLARDGIPISRGRNAVHFDVPDDPQF